MKNPIIVLTGPTASGKTSLSLDIAKKYNCEIICADSMTVYKGMDIGTDKPTLRSCEASTSNNQPTTNKNNQISNFKLQTSNSDNGTVTISDIPHHLIDIVNPDEEFNVTDFVESATKTIEAIRSRGKIPLIVGGSVMYIDALVYAYQVPSTPPNLELREKLETESNEELFEQLCELDPDCEWTIDKHNKRRLIRALEVCMLTGEPFSEQKSKSELPENVLYLALDRDREELYARINSRVDEMYQQGFVEEVRDLLEKYDNNTSLQAAGYKQIVEYIDGKITLDEAIEKTKQVHRNYAKRQLTWLRKNPDVIWITGETDAEKAIGKFLK